MILPLILFLIASFAGPSNPVFIKTAIHEIPPVTFTALRFFVASIVLLPFWFQNKQFLAKKDFIKIVPFALNGTLFALGIQYTSVIVGGVLYCLSPIFTAVLAHLLIKEKITKAHIAGLFVALIGVGLLLHGSFETQDIKSFGTPIGNLIILLAVLSWTFYPVGGRLLSKKYTSTTIVFYNFAFTTLLLCFVAPFEWIIRPIDVSSISLSTIGAVLGGGVVGSALFYFCYQWVIKLTSAFVASFVQYTGIIGSVLYGTLFFGERLTSQLIFGMVLSVVGVFIATTYSQLQKKR